MRMLLVTIGLLVSLVLPCSAGPNTDELKSFKVLVPDYSKTSGGVSPAITPSGDDLAFFSRELGDAQLGDLYTLGPVSLIDRNTTVNPEKLEYGIGSVSVGLCQQLVELRNIDWSPDGDWLAFVGRDGRLYVMQVFDPVTKKRGEARLIATNEEQFSAVKVPRWSPDGKRIAYLKAAVSGQDFVCVADVASGKETVIADDAAEPEFVWQQPWSADSKYIVYASGKIVAKAYITSCNSPKDIGKADVGEDSRLTIASADGSQRRFIECKGSSACPSWSPKGDRIAFACPAVGMCELAERKKYFRYVTMTIWACDTDGKNRRVVTSRTSPSKKEAAEFQAAYDKALTEAFDKQYSKKLSPQQLKRLRSGKMTTKEILDTATSIIFRETGVKITSFNAEMTEGSKLATVTSEHKEIAAKGMAFMQEAALRELLPILLSTAARMDVFPVWSWDGKSIAFVRGMPGDVAVRLIILDAATGKERVIADHSAVECVSWTRSGSLVAQIRRLMSRQENGLETKSQPGHPEVWMLEPK